MNREGDRAISPALLTLIGCALYMVSGGIRCNFGIMVSALAECCGIDYARVSFIAAVGQLMYGLTQPFFGMLAMRRSNGLVLKLGVGMMAAGLLIGSVATGFWPLLLGLGLLFFSGTGAVSFGIIMGTLSPLLGRERASAASGILNAASGIGTSLLSPVIQALQARFGVANTLRALAVPVLVLFPLAFWIARRVAGAEHGEGDAAASGAGNPLKLLGEALRDPDYRRLMAGFGTCGFHMCIIQTHIYAQIVSYGIPESTAALAYTVFGLTSMVGSVLCGVLCQRLPKQGVLGSLYGIRALIVAAFLFLMPKTVFPVFLLIVVLGMTGDATVTPTSSIIAERFGAASLGFLFGITFVCHQVGGFLSSWLGGVFIGGTGNYTLIWCIDIALCAMAATVSYRIRGEGKGQA